MYHFKTIDPATLGLLNSLMLLPALKETRLVGGTALALHIGHRHSVDIDLFGITIGDETDLKEQIYSLGEVTVVQNTPNIRMWLINGIKVDIVRYPFPWISDLIIENNLRLAGINDIAAMKLAAITGRGRKKDFIDIYFLLKKIPLQELLRLYTEKYKDASLLLVIRSLSYFKDADKDEDPKMFKPDKWPEIKSFIRNELDKYSKTLQNI